MRKYLMIAVTLFIAFTALAETREIVQEGIAYLGSDITVEDAQNVAINDARQKALNALGTFIESNQKLVNGRLTKKEISSITGAVMKSKVLSETKTTDGNTFVLKLKVRFEIDMNSFNKALQKYQDQSVDKKTIKRLMATILKMQEEMLRTSKGSFESVEIADEIAYINNRLGKALTTGEKINRELEIRKKYEKNLTQQIINFTKLYMQRLSSSYEWNDVPYKGEYFTSNLPLNSESTCNDARTALGISKNVEVKDVGLGILATIIRYRKNNLRTYPEILPSWSFWRYFHMYINEERYTFLYRARMKAFENLGRGYITIKYSGLLSPHEVSSVGNKSMTYSDHLLIGLNTIESPASCQFGFNNIEIGLPYSVHYTQIKTVNFRWGRFNPNSIEIKLGNVEIGANTLIHVLLNPVEKREKVEKRKKGERSSMSVRSLSKGANGKNLSLLAKELMLWMQANCNVPGVHPEHNFCNLNLNHPLPVITILPQKELSKQFRINNGTLPGGDASVLRGFYLKGTNRIYMKDQDYSNVIYQTDLLHELVHYIQNENSLLNDCITHYEIPAYLMQIHYYSEKTGQGATAEMIDEYKKDRCNTLYK